MLFKILGAIVILAIIAIAVAGVAMWRGLIPVPGPLLALLAGAKEPEYSARFYPADTLAYGWLTLTPGGGQFNDMRDIWQRLNEYPAFSDGLLEIYDNFAFETGIDFEDEVIPWIGPEIAGAVIAVDPGDDGAMPDDAEFWQGFKAAVTIGVRDQDAAAAFLVKWRRYMEKETAADFTAGAYRGYDTWVDAGRYQAYALAGDWLVYATDEGTLQDILVRIDRGGDSLADDANFRAARAALPERRFNSGYVDAKQLTDLADDFASATLGAMGMGSPVGPTPEWAATSGAWVERGIVLEVVSPATDDFGFEVSSLDNPARLLPGDTLAFLAAAFDPDVDHWRTALAEYPLADVLPYPELRDEINAALAEITPEGPGLADDATLADALDLGFGLAKDFTGLDLEAGFFDHLDGKAILAVSEFDFEGIDDDPANNPISAVAMLSYRADGKDGLQDTMDEVTKLIDENLFFFAESDTADVGGDADATVFRITDTQYAPGYVLHDGYLTLGSTEAALATIVSRQKGEGAALRDSAEYLRATGQLPPRERQFLGYVNLQGIIGQLDADEMGMDADEYRILAEGFGVIAMGAVSDPDYYRGALALTLFPE